MTEKSLYAAQIDAGLDQARGAGMTQNMRYDLLVLFQPGLFLYGVPVIEETRKVSGARKPNLRSIVL